MSLFGTTQYEFIKELKEERQRLVTELGNIDSLISEYGNIPDKLKGELLEEWAMFASIDLIQGLDYIETGVSRLNEIIGMDSTQLKKAAKLVVERKVAATTLLQREMGLGFSRATRIIEKLAEMGIIAIHEGSKPAEVLGTDLSALQEFEEFKD